jgi:FkbM family methyltransferase
MLQARSQSSKVLSQAPAQFQFNKRKQPADIPADKLNVSNLIPEGSHVMLSTFAPLDESGLEIATATCCDLEMETFLRRVVVENGLEICHEPSFLAMIPTYSTCGQARVRNFTTLVTQFSSAMADTNCQMVAVPGSCPQAQPGCDSTAAFVQDERLDSNRRRACTPRMEKPSPDDQCQLPESAVWCEVRLKNLAPYWMAVYDWSKKSDFVSFNVCEAGFWDQKDPAEFGAPGNMLDIGGNMGYFTLALAHSGWNVTTFEPMAPNLAMLNASLCKNPDIARKVKLNQFGLGQTNQECKMFAPAANIGDGHVQCGDDVAAGFTDEPGKPNSIDAFDVVEIGKFSIRRLDEVLKEQNISKVDLVKIDVEGYESQVLAGAGNFLTEYKPTRLKIEVWNNSFGFSGTHFLNQFESAGYKFFTDSVCQTQTDAQNLVLNGLWEGFACAH